MPPLQRLLLVSAFLAGEFHPPLASFGRKAVRRAAFPAGRLDTGLALLDDEGFLFHRFADQPFSLFPHRLFRHPSSPIHETHRGDVLAQPGEISTADTEKAVRPRLHDEMIDRQPEMAWYLRFRRAAGAEHIDQAHPLADAAELAELRIEERMIRQRRYRTRRQPGTRDLEPDAVEMTSAEERLFIARPAEQDDCRRGRGLRAIRQQGR